MGKRECFVEGGYLTEVGTSLDLGVVGEIPDQGTWIGEADVVAYHYVSMDGAIVETPWGAYRDETRRDG